MNANTAESALECEDSNAGGRVALLLHDFSLLVAPRAAKIDGFRCIVCRAPLRDSGSGRRGPIPPSLLLHLLRVSGWLSDIDAGECCNVMSEPDSLRRLQHKFIAAAYRSSLDGRATNEHNLPRKDLRYDYKAKMAISALCECNALLDIFLALGTSTAYDSFCTQATRRTRVKR
ncbi:hypothetical protein AC579_6516 [Pseudocercospora musae]|uniref:Uncharacterized protein n=1 Tax=Pseudocercospora musae TaxID=113226 RepID=A0A139I3R0_9PEZI|nr:hypothetical protein AC579_6516 [Pseudocercospora musae]